jgi:hypothetical protein
MASYFGNDNPLQMKYPRGEKSRIIRQFILDNPKLKDDKGRAREILRQNPKMFPDLEAARSLVRSVTGKHGDKGRQEIKDPEKIKFFFEDKWAKENLNTELQPWDEPFIIPSTIKDMSIIADLHSINLENKCMQSFLKATKKKEALIINGDLMDSESLSRHLKGHNLIAYEDELELCHNILKALKQEFNHVYFKEGNHDFWLERYLLSNAREIFRLRGVELKELLRLGELGVHWIHNLKAWTYGDLNGVHGHEFPGYGMGKFPATGLLDKWQRFKHRIDVKVIGSHCHKNDMAISKKSVDGKFGYAWITPAMCRKAASYNPYAPNDLGWGQLSINNDGYTEVKMTVL